MARLNWRPSKKDALTWTGNNPMDGDLSQEEGTPVMPAPIIQRPSSHAPYYDAIEILMIAAGVLLIATMASMF
jgi:hypothetical protein